jgi:CubicO group peptidase (beta-lactamase class C family)
VLGHFPEIGLSDPDPRKREITIRDLLTMHSGFRWDEGRDFCVFGSPDPVQWMFNLPLADPPGQVFHYSSGATQILAHLVQRISGLAVREFAGRELFAPLGIQDFDWPEDARGVSLGYAGLALTTRDLAKLGLLYLRQGKWEGQELLPARYVREATTAWSPGGDPEGKPYGYLWWVDHGQPGNAYFASGYGGQYLWVSPALDLIAVLTAEYRLPPAQMKDVYYLITDYVIPAVRA